MYKTSFGKYSAVDFDTYKKIKKIKAAINVSDLKTRRYHKLQKRKPWTRLELNLNICDLFYEKKEKEVWQYGDYNREKREWEKIYSTIDYYEATSLVDKYRELWDIVKNVKSNPDDLPEVKIPDNLDEVYEVSLAYINDYAGLSLA